VSLLTLKKCSKGVVATLIEERLLLLDNKKESWMKTVDTMRQEMR
jgi:hypothetical protein